MNPTPNSPKAGEAQTAELREVTLGHKHDGGTGITNFPASQAEIYREAIRLHGDPAMVVSERDFMEGHASLFSLHDLTTTEREFGLTEFWSVFDLVSALYEKRKLFGVEHTGASNWVRYRDECTRLESSHSSLLASHERLKQALAAASTWLSAPAGAGYTMNEIEEIVNTALSTAHSQNNG